MKMFSSWPSPVIATLSAPGVVFGFCASVILHPLVYRPGASRFSQLRAGPAIGLGLVLWYALVLRRAIRRHGGHDETFDDLLAHLWSAAAIGAGTMAADLWRSLHNESQ